MKVNERSIETILKTLYTYAIYIYFVSHQKCAVVFSGVTKTMASNQNESDRKYFYIPVANQQSQIFSTECRLYFRIFCYC